MVLLVQEEVLFASRPKNRSVVLLVLLLKRRRRTPKEEPLSLLERTILETNKQTLERTILETTERSGSSFGVLLLEKQEEQHLRFFFLRSKKNNTCGSSSWDKFFWNTREEEAARVCFFEPFLWGCSFSLEEPQKTRKQKLWFFSFCSVFRTNHSSNKRFVFVFASVEEEQEEPETTEKEKEVLGVLLKRTVRSEHQNKKKQQVWRRTAPGVVREKEAVLGVLREANSRTTGSVFLLQRKKHQNSRLALLLVVLQRKKQQSGSWGKKRTAPLLEQETLAASFSKHSVFQNHSFLVVLFGARASSFLASRCVSEEPQKTKKQKFVFFLVQNKKTKSWHTINCFFSRESGWVAKGDRL